VQTIKKLNYVYFQKVIMILKTDWSFWRLLEKRVNIVKLAKQDKHLSCLLTIVSVLLDSEVGKILVREIFN
jgi:hypothetical protein